MTTESAMTAPAYPAPLPDIHTTGSDPGLLRDELRHTITAAITNHPRSQQTRIGPSEIGTPCTRRLGYKLAGVPEANPREAAWKPTVGTAVHAWLAETFLAANEKLPDTRWLVEMGVNAGTVGNHPLTGSCDLYDRVTATLIDWKVVGVSTLRKYKANGPGDTYRVQAHTYGLGWTRRGYPVETVAIYFLPQNGELADGHYWHEPYDAGVALAAIARADAVAKVLAAAGPDVLAHLPTADAWCSFCPWHRSGATNLAEACPGDPGSAGRADPVLSLIAPNQPQGGKQR